MATVDDLEARLAVLEQRLAVPLAANPPVTVGELVDVPAPGSPIASQWAQEVSNRVVQRFANKAALDAWAAAAGSMAVTVDANLTWIRKPTGWVHSPVPQQQHVTGVVVTIGAGASGPVLNGTLTPVIPAGVLVVIDYSYASSQASVGAVDVTFTCTGQLDITDQQSGGASAKASSFRRSFVSAGVALTAAISANCWGGKATSFSAATNIVMSW